MMLPSGRFEPQNNVYGIRRLSFAVAERCAYPFRYGLPTTCSDVIIYKNSECADRRASAPAPLVARRGGMREVFLV
jgi:hypothetical protein